MPDLTEKQRKFVEAYMGETGGNATEAARLAGYGGNENALAAAGARLLRNVKISEAINERQANDPLIASREDRQRFWSEVMNDSTQDMKDRLRASEILGKSQADFIDRKEISGPNGGPVPFTSVNTDPYDE